MDNRHVKVGDKINYTLSRDSWQGVIVVEVNDGWVRADNGYGNIGLFHYNDFELANDNSPVRTVTRREIVPGVYGTVTVSQTYCGEYKYCIEPYATADQLRSAARIFNEIADVLDENAEVKKEAA